MALLLGIGFCLLEDKFQYTKLSEADYFLSYAPVSIEFWPIAWLNLGTLVVTLLFLVIPSLIVRRITPAQAIRFD